MAMEALRIAAKESKIMKFILGGFIFLAVGGLVFTDVGGYFTGSARGTTVAQVGDYKIEIREFDQGFRQFANQMQMTPEDAYASGLATIYLNGRVGQVIRAEAAQDLDIELSDEDIAKQLKQIFGDRTRADIEMILRAQGMTEALLKQNIQSGVQTQMINDLPKAVTHYVPTYMTKLEERLSKQRRSGTVYTIDKKALSGDIKISDEDINVYYQTNIREFTNPEKRSFILGTMHVAMIKKSLPKVTNDDIQSEYETRLDEFTTPEQRLLSQVTIKDADQAQAIYEAATNSKSLKKAIIEVQGDDKGYRKPALFEQDALPVELSDVAFQGSAQKGDVLPPVKTLLGYVVMQLDDIKKSRVKPLSEVKNTLKKELAVTRLYDALYNKMVDTEDMLDTGASFDDIVTKTSLKTTNVNAVLESELSTYKNDDWQAVFKASPSVAQGLFSLAAGQTTYPIELSDDQYAVISVRDIEPETVKPLDDVQSQIKNTLTKRQIDAAAMAKASMVIAQLNQGELTTDQLKKDFKARRKNFKSVTKNNDQYDVKTLFSMGMNDYAISAKSDDDIMIYHLTNVDFKGKSDIDYNDMVNEQSARIGNAMDQYWLDHISVSINEAVLNLHYGQN